MDPSSKQPGENYKTSEFSKSTIRQQTSNNKRNTESLLKQPISHRHQNAIQAHLSPSPQIQLLQPTNYLKTRIGHDHSKHKTNQGTGV